MLELLENNLLSNPKCTVQVLLQKKISTNIFQIKSDGLMDRYFYTNTHEAIISDEIFIATQQEKLTHTKKS